MVNLLGPGAFGAARPAAVRPTFTPDDTPGNPDDWFKDCSSPTARDGTEWRSALLNALIALMRRVVRLSGVAESNDDPDLLAKAIQTQKFNHANDTGTADALVVTLAPVPSAYSLGLPVRVKKGSNANATTTPTINVNSLGAKTIVAWHGGALGIGDLPAGASFELLYDGTNFRLMQPGAKQVGLRKVQRFLTSTTFTVPDGVYWLWIDLWGAGGGGGAGNGSGQSGGGGAGGAYCGGFLAVTPGQTIPVTVGQAAAAVGVGSNGNAGGATSVVVGATTLTAPGGGGGLSGGGGALGGSPSNASGGDINITGGQGGNFFSASLGGRGGESPRGGSGSGAGNNGNAPGGGGGGGGISGNGPVGANGMVCITY